MIEWLCGMCGEWVPLGYTEHHHQELGLPSVKRSVDDPLGCSVPWTTYQRSHSDAVRYEQDMKKPEAEHVLCEREIVQLAPSHKWAGCLAVVDKVKPYGCRAYVTGPISDGSDTSAQFYIILAWEEFERIGASVLFEPKA